MKRVWPICLALVLLAVACDLSPNAPAQPVPIAFTSAEQEVLEALLVQCPLLKRSTEYVIEDTSTVLVFHVTSSYQAFETRLRADSRKHGRAFRRAVDDFLWKNKFPAELVLQPRKGLRVHWVSAADLQEIFADAYPRGWDRFRERWPGAKGCLEVSRVGIDPKGKVAIIYLGQQADYLSGMGMIWVLRHDGKQWQLTEEHIGPAWGS